MSMTLRLTSQQDRALTLLAQAQGSSKQEAAVRAIVATAARTLANAEITALASELIEDYAHTLHTVKKHQR
ncbi:CopG family protein [Corynebacterium kutscheri]|uniref:CopG family transcriptional regulator n=1 Tax=Corynebacterium kutscheri TaxID=35755 RepID=UPI000F6D038C|nr:CopG family transcriptional regulator [Corynebacterium kutscheri]VEH81470.1 CopG family protein [Corynebacterium kutscheri]